MDGKLAYIGLGANLGERLGNLRRAAAQLAGIACPGSLRSSRVYESPPWGYTSDHSFLNAVVELRWAGTPDNLREECARIESALGRPPRMESTAAQGGGLVEDSSESTRPYHDRVIDLDLLWFEGADCNTTLLTLPHPRAHLRAFVLLPWLELAPDLELDGRTLSAWLAELDAHEIAATEDRPELKLMSRVDN
jgi:2-amino-4-hydroxy-6-hydroxymethyldihydropteridine diphosphokinase